MTSVPEPFVLLPGQIADANQVEADFAAMRTIVNGSLEMGVNVRAGATSALDGSSSSEGSSLLGARADHTHAVRGVEQLASDPPGSIGREYFNTATKQKKICIATGPDVWVVIGNQTGSDLPTHASRHATGGADPLPANSVAQTMFAARTIYEGVPAADVNPTANAWTDVVTGLAVTVTNSQVAWLVVHAGVSNTSGSNSPKVALRIIDGSSNILFMSNNRQMSTAGANNDAYQHESITPILLSASPTLKLQVNTDQAGPRVLKSQTINGSTYAVTRLQVVVG